VSPGEIVTCTFTDLKRGQIVVVKDAQPNDAQDFAFTTTGTGLSSFSLDDDADPTLSNTQVFSGLLPGTRTVSETAVAGWSLTNLVCNDANGSVSGSTATINQEAWAFGNSCDREHGTTRRFREEPKPVSICNVRPIPGAEWKVE